MRHLHNFQLKSAILFGSLFAVLGQELKGYSNIDDTIETAIIIVASFILSSIFAPLFSNQIVRIRLVRKLLFRANWVEGFWYNISQDPQKDADIFEITSVTEISFRGTDLGLQTVGYRILDNKEIYTFSQYVILIGENNLYLNFYTSSAKGVFRNLIAAGYFYRSPGTKQLDTFDGVVLELDGSVAFRQRATRIPDDIVKTLKKRHNGNWIPALLSDSDAQKDLLLKTKFDGKPVVGDDG